MKRLSVLWSALCLVLVLGWLVPTLAQDNVITRSDPLVQEAERVLSAAERDVADVGADDVILAERRLDIERIETGLAAARTEQRNRIDELSARLTELGDPSDLEDAEVTTERTRLTAERAALVTAVSVLDESIDRAGEIGAAIADRRRTIFQENLLRRRDVGATFSSDTLGALLGEVGEIVTIVSTWLDRTIRNSGQTLLLAGLIVVAAILAALAGTARLRDVLVSPTDPGRRPTYLRRVSRALGTIVLRTVGVALLAVFLFMTFEWFGVIDGTIAPLLAATLAALVALQFTLTVIRTALTPREPQWRLLNLDDRASSTLSWLASLIVFAFVFDVWFGEVAQLTGAPLRVIVAENFIAAIVIGIALVAIAQMKAGRLEPSKAAPVQRPPEPDIINDAEAELSDELVASPKEEPVVVAEAVPAGMAGLGEVSTETPSISQERRHWSALIRVPLLVLGIGIILAALLGYIGLAQFAAKQIVVTGAILATMYIGFLTAREIRETGTLRQSAIGRSIRRRRDLREERYDQIGVLASLAISAAVLLVGIPLILLQWGFQAGEIGGWALAALEGVQVGSVTISLGGILLGIAVFALGFILTRSFQRWLDQSVMERGRVDSGVRNSVRTIVGYVCLVIAALVALSIAGVNLSSLAFVAGALSVGIGFGLQNVVSNFVSGLILLAERPFRVGDIVETGSTLGVIQRISVRSTTIETFTKQSVIVPNSDLINGVVSNWTLGNRLARCDIPVGVSYGADPRKVEALLLKIAKGHKLILKDPPPMVAFMGFGASSLDFELRAFVANVSDKVPTTNELSYRIFDKLAAEGIPIPFPQREVAIVGADGLKGVLNGQERPTG